MGVAGRRCGGCCPGRRWWCLIANVMEGVAYRVLPVSPYRAIGFLGVSLVVFDRVCPWAVLLMVLDCGCGWEVSQRVARGVRSRIWVGGVVLGGVARDVVGGVLWGGFFGLVGFIHP